MARRQNGRLRTVAVMASLDAPPEFDNPSAVRTLGFIASQMPMQDRALSKEIKP